jgi:DHA2 family methylenomycin A resistance protein-like MFS transporter
VRAVRDATTGTGRPALVLLVAAAAQALGVGSASIVAVALPGIAADLGASTTAQQWIVDAYVLVFAALLVTGGVLGDRRGRRAAFLLGLGLFAGGSLVCALAPSTGVLVAGRVLQGLGSPILVPASLGLVTLAYPEPAARARAIGLWSIGSGAGLTLGPCSAAR